MEEHSNTFQKSKKNTHALSGRHRHTKDTAQRGCILCIRTLSSGIFPQEKSNRTGSATHMSDKAGTAPYFYTLYHRLNKRTFEKENNGLRRERGACATLSPVAINIGNT